MLGPTLFLIYINDLPDTITFNISLYADDTLLYQEVKTQQDEAEFQSNIDAVQAWSERWKMPFNASKCNVISFGNDMSKPDYKLGRFKLSWINRIKYLEVVLQSNLKFDIHVTEKIGSARRILGGIKHLLYEAP